MSQQKITSPNSAVSLIEGLALYVEKGTADAQLALCEQAIGTRQLRRICIGLLSWLKSRAKFPQMVSNKLSDFGSAELALLSLIKDDSPLSEVFTICDGAIQLRETLSASEKEKLIAAAAKLYNPPRFTTARRRQST